MAVKIRRGIFGKRFYCGNCNSRVSEDDTVCQKCGEQFIEPKAKHEKPLKPGPASGKGAGQPEPAVKKEALYPGPAVKKSAGRPRPAVQPKTPASGAKRGAEAEEEFEEEAGPEEEFEEDAGDFAEEDFAAEGGQPAAQPAPAGIFSLSPLKTLLWVIVAGMLLLGLFSSNVMLLVATVLVLILIELEAIRRKLGSG